MSTNNQIRAEVQERASKITIPLVLDVRIQQNTNFQQTWLNRPLDLTHVPEMVIQFRCQPVDLIAFGEKFTALPWHPAHTHVDILTDDDVWWHLPNDTLCLIEHTLFNMLLHQIYTSQARPRYNLLPEKVDSIAHLSLEILPMLDDTGAELRIPDLDLWYSPYSELQSYIESYFDNKVLFAKDEPVYPPYRVAQCRDVEDRYPMLMRVGSIEICSGKETRRELGASRQDLDTRGKRLTPDMRAYLGKLRQERGWNEVGTEDKKRKRATEDA
jgi:hypothetical protein